MAKKDTPISKDVVLNMVYSIDCIEVNGNQYLLMPKNTHLRYMNGDIYQVVRSNEDKEDDRKN